MEYHPGFDIQYTLDPLGFSYGPYTFGPSVEHRRLDSIRKSLRDPGCKGPEVVYAIAMDVGRKDHLPLLIERNLLFGTVAYAKGQLGSEPIRSQGHIHSISPTSGWSTPEVYEVWAGQAVIYMQERATDDPGRCFAVTANPGDVVVVPPYWAHATISANPYQSLVFGAWCVRDYSFEYDEVREHQGLAWYPTLCNGSIVWEKNPRYLKTNLIEKRPSSYPTLEIAPDVPIYSQFEDDPDRFLFVSRPMLKKEVWIDFEP